jgi:hypothetical protein
VGEGGGGVLVVDKIGHLSVGVHLFFWFFALMIFLDVFAISEKIGKNWRERHPLYRGNKFDVFQEASGWLPKFT